MPDKLLLRLHFSFIPLYLLLWILGFLGIEFEDVLYTLHKV